MLASRGLEGSDSGRGSWDFGGSVCVESVERASVRLFL